MKFQNIKFIIPASNFCLVNQCFYLELNISWREVFGHAFVKFQITVSSQPGFEYSCFYFKKKKRLSKIVLLE